MCIGQVPLTRIPRSNYASPMEERGISQRPPREDEGIGGTIPLQIGQTTGGEQFAEVVTMKTPLVLARIIGPVMVASAVSVLLNLHAYPRLVEEYSKSPSLCYLGGFMALLLGLVILQFHHKWELSWPVLITIIGWLCVVKGAVLMIIPGTMLTVLHPLTASSLPLMVSSLISLCIGAFLTLKGYRSA